MARKKVGEGKYSKVTRRMWNDASFKRLTPIPPSGQSLWVKLLTAPYLTNVPGLFSQRQSGMAEDLGWSFEDFRRCWDEVAREEMAFADWASGLVWVPNAIRHNEPESIYVVEAWEPTLLDLPECELKTRALEHFEAYFAEKGGAWYKAWRKASRKISGMPPCVPSRMASSIQEQEQEQEQDPPVIPPTEAEPPPVSNVVPIARPSVSGGSELADLPMEKPIIKNTDNSANEPQKPRENRGEPPPRPRQRLEALEQNFAELCRALEQNPHNASFCAVQERSEVVQFHEAYCAATGLAVRRLGAYQRDAGVRAICTLYALDYSLEDLLELVRFAPKDLWIMGSEVGANGRPKDISALTPVKAGALLDMARAAKAKTERIKAKREAEIERERQERIKERNRDRTPPPSPREIEALIANVANTGFASPKPTTPTTQTRVVVAPPPRRAPVTAEELDRILEEQDAKRKKAANG